jgi:hypothetical protein
MFIPLDSVNVYCDLITFYNNVLTFLQFFKHLQGSHYFQIREREVTSLSESSQGEVGDNREKWGDFWEKLIAINRNILSRPL